MLIIKKVKAAKFFFIFLLFLIKVFHLPYNFLLWKFLHTDADCCSKSEHPQLLLSLFLSKSCYCQCKYFNRIHMFLFLLPDFFVCVYYAYQGCGSWHSFYTIMTKYDQYYFSLISESEVKTLSSECLLKFSILLVLC